MQALGKGGSIHVEHDACHVFVECALHVDGRTVSVPLLNEKQLVARSTAEAAGKRCDPYRDTETDRVPQKEQKIAAAVYLYQADNDGEWGNLRFDFESGTAEIVKLADWDTVKSNIFAKTAIRFVQGLPEARLLKFVVVPFWKGWT